MSLISEYQKYVRSGGTLPETDYANYRNQVTAFVVKMISDDPDNVLSDIGQRIFDYLSDDLSSSAAFCRVSKAFYTRAQNSWLATKTHDIILAYIRRNATYKNYLRDGGWKDFLILGAKVAGVALTITSGVYAAQHARRIPADAPKKIIKYTDEDGYVHEIKYIDHPEAKETETWTTVTACVGSATITGIIGDGIRQMLKDVNLNIFFSDVERDIIGTTKMNPFLKLVSSDFEEWKIDKMKQNLLYVPPNWQEDEELKNYVCPISGDFMLFPVVDRCGHSLDYRSVRGYQLDPRVQNPSECPVSTTKPNFGLIIIKFNKSKFDIIQRRLNFLRLQHR